MSAQRNWSPPNTVSGSASDYLGSHWHTLQMDKIKKVDYEKVRNASMTTKSFFSSSISDCAHKGCGNRNFNRKNYTISNNNI